MNLNAFLTGLNGALVEAWAQLRIGKLRVMLSLVGVAVAVAAMTFIIAFGQIAVAAIEDSIQQYTGRPGTVTVTINSSSQDSGSALSGSVGAPPPGALEAAAASSSSESTSVNSVGEQEDASTRARRAEKDFVERYEVQQWATNYDTTLRVNGGQGSSTLRAKIVSPSYAIMHRTQLNAGRWFSAEDTDDLSPSMVVSEGFLRQLGIEHLTGPVKVEAYEPVRTTYTIVGTMPDDEWLQFSDGPVQYSAFVLAEPYERLLPSGEALPIPTLEVWAGQERAAEVESLMNDYFGGIFGRQGATVSNNLSQSGESGDQMATFTRVVTGGGVFIMLIGALSLINISIITVKQRIHEIGVRRSFGATNRRIFFSIMLESVVATVVAGVIGIIIAILLMRVVPLEPLVGMPVRIRPPFPMSAALIGLLSATGVGALSGIIPAIVAVRIKPIDAIRI